MNALLQRKVRRETQQDADPEWVPIFFWVKRIWGSKMSGATGRTEPRRYSEEESGKEKLEK